jgi:hypothetical protein
LLAFLVLPLQQLCSCGDTVHDRNPVPCWDYNGIWQTVRANCSCKRTRQHDWHNVVKMMSRCPGLWVGLLLLFCCIPVSSLAGAHRIQRRIHEAQKPGSSSIRMLQKHEVWAARQLLHHEVVNDHGALLLQQWYENTTLFTQTQGSSCFPGGTVHKAADIQGEQACGTGEQHVGDHLCVFVSSVYPICCCVHICRRQLAIQTPGGIAH